MSRLVVGHVQVYVIAFERFCGVKTFTLLVIVYILY